MEPVDPNDPLALNALFSGGGEPWAPILKPVIEGLPLAELFISPRRSRKVVPVRELTFQALKPNPPERWKVVVFGQNPYPRPESATGIAMFDNAFHSWNDKRFEYVASVRNIIKAALHWRHGVDVTLDAWQLRELLTTYAVVQPPEWFQAILAQGVLLLNASLTASADSGIPIEQHLAFWQPVTRAVTEAILSAKQRADAQHKGVVFAWWGVHARGLKPMVEALSRKYPDVPVRHVDHWNPAARDDRFCQGNHFKDINAALVSVGASRIAWLPTPGWQSRLMPSLETAQKMGDFVQETMDLHKLYLERLQGARDERLTDLPPIQGLLDGARVPLSQALTPVLATLSTVQSAAQSALAFEIGRAHV